MAVAVIDIGKTNAKLALVDLATLSETAVRKMPNVVRTDGDYPHYDTEALWNFILDGLAEFARAEKIDAISITTHGATAALMAADGTLALPILDYEYAGPDSLAEEYARVRPSFDETGSPKLPGGLNIGAQLYWQSRTYPDRWSRVQSILMYPQYYGYRLTGVAVGEATSLGCHTDLWSPHRQTYSPMGDQLGWSKLMPPVRYASSRLGPLLPALAARTGLPADTPVYVGIHDSNASLLPHLLGRTGSFSVLSTGTWVIALAIGSAPVKLDPARDTLINVNAKVDPVPSARFMGGRENSLLGEGLPAATPADIAAVLNSRLFYLPAAVSGSGPFPHATGHWSADGTPGERRAALSFYLALMSATCLELIGARGPTIIEGPFAANLEFCAMLHAATGREVVAQGAGTGTSTGTSIGAALLTRPERRPEVPPPSDTPINPGYSAYAQAWRAAVR